MIKVNKKIISTGIGVIAGAIGGKVLTSKLAKKAAVATVQQGLKAKSAVDKTVENIKVTTDDIVAEAKIKNEIEERLEAEAKDKLDIENVASEAKEEVKEEIIKEIKED
ncbi:MULTISPECIES: DUF6110 family protein [Anaerococcus]|uniref:DUF1490 family protein n=1 Tax=Anaerococcus obesiensis TaxID=1287640 RepID=A0A7T7UUZ3_9FIRM|nr:MULTISPECIES: DUF6110 family protein [Anaerococcus]MBS6921785.1 DUF1490 family protein [Anaerococcus vaginalis]MDU0945851.1 DUF6110 family protein [Anaerococcus vaginalis]MDU1029698.1 DUF6110 family protein [Anaerococcus vaginalis]MDU1763112.1 DUF6110 family protein [Anaerococcus vaginalis]MDU2649353.1 DUF6110 family protein [Anaerococcus vaginalis]